MSAPHNPDTDSLDQDSTLGDSRSRTSSTRTVSTSIFNYLQKYGRTYHNYRDAQYLFPNDRWEKDRLDLQHELFLAVLDSQLFLAPISFSPQAILDVGTGTGIWAIDMADLYPSASVIGIDISPMQPEWVPPNCKFQVDDANTNWTFTERFDFIHCRQLHMAVEERRLLEQSFGALKEGGWLEIKEFALPLSSVDDTLDGTALATWGEAMMEASRKIKTPFDNPHKYRRLMEEAGFVNVKELVYHLPLGPWARGHKLKLIGGLQLANLKDGLEGFSLALFIEHLKWSRAELEVLLAGVRKDISNRHIHAFATLVCVVGQKPPG